MLDLLPPTTGERYVLLQAEKSTTSDTSVTELSFSCFSYDWDPLCTLKCLKTYSINTIIIFFSTSLC